MSQQATMTVNRLPVTTWNWLKMNETTLTLPNSSEKIEMTADSFSEIETGMGKELDQYFSGVKATRLINDQEVVELHYRAGTVQAERFEIEARKNSQTRYVFVMDSKENGAGVSALSIKVKAEEGAKVWLYVIQMLDQEKTGISNLGATLEKDASLELVKLELGKANLYSGGFVNLVGDRSSFNMQLGYIGQGSQHLDMNYVARHQGKHTVCLMKSSGALKDFATKLFRGSIDFRHGCAGSKGEEQEDVLLLGDRVVNQTIPLILCEEEDVEGNHGASIGELDEQMLFYLGTRGISREEAEKLLVQARIDAILDQVPVKEVRDQVRNYIGEENEDARL